MDNPIYFLLLFASLFFTACTSTKEFISNSPSKIETVYFQNWIGGQEQTGAGTNFYIKLANQLPENVYLAKVYFQDKEADFDKQDETNFVAHFYYKPKNTDTKDSNTIKAPERTTPKFKLKPTEAVLEFHSSNKAEYFKIVGIKEKELIAYPSAGPRN